MLSPLWKSKNNARRSPLHPIPCIRDVPRCGQCNSLEAAMPPLTIPPALLERCYAHGSRTYPEEGCGVLSGPDGEENGLDACQPIANILNRVHAEDPERYPRTAAEGYYMDPAEMIRLDKALAAEGRKVKVVFHTHVDVGAYFSEEDITRALWAGEPVLPGVAYLVCGIRAGEPDGAILAFFDEETRQFQTVPVE